MTATCSACALSLRRPAAAARKRTTRARKLPVNRPASVELLASVELHVGGGMGGGSVGNGSGMGDGGGMGGSGFGGVLPSFARRISDLCSALSRARLALDCSGVRALRLRVLPLAIPPAPFRGPVPAAPPAAPAAALPDLRGVTGPSVNSSNILRRQWSCQLNLDGQHPPGLCLLFVCFVRCDIYMRNG